MVQFVVVCASFCHLYGCISLHHCAISMVVFHCSAFVENHLSYVASFVIFGTFGQVQS